MPDHLTQLLDQIDLLDESATPGPWRYEHTESPTFISGPDLQEITNAVWSDTDAIYIELARTALPQLGKALRAVMELLDHEEEQQSGAHTTVFFGGKKAPALISVNVLRLSIQNAMKGDEDA